MRLELGSSVDCTDGPFGKLADVVVDPTKRSVTALGRRATDGDMSKARLVRRARQPPRRAIPVPSRFAVPWRRRTSWNRSRSTRTSGSANHRIWSQGGIWVSRAFSPSRTTPPASATKRCRRLRPARLRDLRPSPQGRGRDPAGERSDLGGWPPARQGGRVPRRRRRCHHALRARAGPLWGRARSVGTIPINAVADVFTDAVTLTADEGRSRRATVRSQSHRWPPVSSGNRTVARAPPLTSDPVLRALRARRCRTVSGRSARAREFGRLERRSRSAALRSEAAPPPLLPA